MPSVAELIPPFVCASPTLVIAPIIAQAIAKQSGCMRLDGSAWLATGVSVSLMAVYPLGKRFLVDNGGLRQAMIRRIDEMVSAMGRADSLPSDDEIKA